MTEKIEIWGRKFNILVDYNLYPDEVASDEQKARLASFTSKPQLLNDITVISEYCLKNNGKEIGTNIDNIFKYVIPTSIFIPKCNNKNRVVLLCNYKFDIEHGLAIIYENNQFVGIVSQDYVL